MKWENEEELKHIPDKTTVDVSHHHHSQRCEYHPQISPANELLMSWNLVCTEIGLISMRVC